MGEFKKDIIQYILYNIYDTHVFYYISARRWTPFEPARDKSEDVILSNVRP